MRIATIPAHLVATDAVGSGALIVTARAEQDVAPRGRTVKTARPRVVADPARRMRIPPFDQASAHTTRQMAAVASVRRMTAQAERRLRLRFESVTGHEVAAVHETGLHGFRAPTFHAELLGRVMTAFAVGLRVTRLTQLLLLRGLDSVVLHEVSRVSQERLREQAPDLGERVTRRTLPAVPLLFVFVATEAFAHRRQRRTARFHHTRMTRHALPLDAFQRQVQIVIEGDTAVGMLDRCRDLCAEPARVPVMAACAATHGRHGRSNAATGGRVTADASQACGFAGNAAGKPCQV
jgi:hypothetical protein